MDMPVSVDPVGIVQAISRRAQTDPLIAAVLDAAMWESAYRATMIPQNGNETVEQEES